MPISLRSAPAKEVHYSIYRISLTGWLQSSTKRSRLKRLKAKWYGTFNLEPYDALEETWLQNQFTRFVNIKLIIYRLIYLFLANCRNFFIHLNVISIAVKPDGKHCGTYLNLITPVPYTPKIVQQSSHKLNLGNIRTLYNP